MKSVRQKRYELRNKAKQNLNEFYEAMMEDGTR